MKIEKLIEQLQRLQKSMPGADVRLHHPDGTSALFALAYDEHFCPLSYRNIVWIEDKRDIDIGEELESRFVNASEKQLDELDFYMDLLDTGFTLKDIQMYCPDRYEHVAHFIYEHGLI